MINASWAGTTGLDAQTTRFGSTSDNLANAGSSAFGRLRVMFAMLSRHSVRPPGTLSSPPGPLPDGASDVTGGGPATTERFQSRRNLRPTGESPDHTISGQGLFRIRMPDGTTAYTRDGAFQLGNEGI